MLGGAEIGEISVMQARPWVILCEAVHDFVVHVKRNVQAVAVLNDEKPFLDLRFAGLFIALDTIEDLGVCNEKVAYSMRDLYIVNPFELTLERCEHATGRDRVSVPQAAR